MQKKMMGFSLVELLVVMTIVLVLAGIGSYSINKFIQTNKVSKLRDDIYSQMKLARSLAITNQLPNSTGDLSFVRVTILSGIITVEGVNNGVGTTSSPYFSKKIDTPDNTSVTITNNSTSVNSFGFLSKTGRLTDSLGVLSNGPVVIKFSDGSDVDNLTINDLGIISDDD